ncbi:hypothetical protein FRB99_006475 [Tulasnella sp. 403]|nr:hypothetical protein FRB99_006475 [Tulasnella sp. 403]
MRDKSYQIRTLIAVVEEAENAKVVCECSEWVSDEDEGGGDEKDEEKKGSYSGDSSNSDDSSSSDNSSSSSDSGDSSDLDEESGDEEVGGEAEGGNNAVPEIASDVELANSSDDSSSDDDDPMWCSRSCMKTHPEFAPHSVLKKVATGLERFTENSLETLSKVNEREAAAREEWESLRKRDELLEDELQPALLSKLPVELLFYILQDAKQGDRNIVTSFSQVNRFFRNVILQTPALWANIEIMHTKGRRALEMFLPPMFTLEAGQQRIQSFVRQILPHMNRVPRVDMVYYNKQWMDAALPLLACKSALDALDVRLPHSSREGSPVRDAILKIRCMPRTLKIHGIHLWGATRLFSERVTSFRLVKLSALPIGRLQRAFNAMVNLEDLYLEGLSIVLPGDWEVTRAETVISLPHLQNLEIIQFCQPDAFTLLSALQSACLSSFTFARSFSKGDTDRIRPILKLAGTRNLHIASLEIIANEEEMDSEEWADVLASFPSLSCLRVAGSELEAECLRSLVKPDGTDEEMTPYACPYLEELVLDNEMILTSGVIRDIVVSRYIPKMERDDHGDYSGIRTVILRGWDRDNVKDAHLREIQQRVDELVLGAFDAKSAVCVANDTCSSCDSESSDDDDRGMFSGDEEVMKGVLELLHGLEDQIRTLIAIVKEAEDAEVECECFDGESNDKNEGDGNEEGASSAEPEDASDDSSSDENDEIWCSRRCMRTHPEFAPHRVLKRVATGLERLTENLLETLSKVNEREVSAREEWESLRRRDELFEPEQPQWLYQLPTELLFCILQDAKQSDRDITIAFSQVSTFFRNVILQAPDLWADIEIMHTRGQRAMHLERSGDHPLLLEMFLPPMFTLKAGQERIRSFVGQVLPYMNRVQKVDMVYTWKEWMDTALPLLACNCTLDTLGVGLQNVMGTRTPPPDVDAGSVLCMPRSLRIHGIYLWDSTSLFSERVTSFRLVDVPTLPIRRLQQALNAMVNVEDLCLENVSIIVPEDWEVTRAETVISLQHLQNLEITQVRQSDVLMLLSALQSPRLSSFTLARSFSGRVLKLVGSQNPQIVSLKVIANYKGLGSDGWTDVLTSFPSLTYLRTLGPELDEDCLRSLVKPDGNDDSEAMMTYACPYLEELVLDNEMFLTSGVVKDIVVSRYTPKTEGDDGYSGIRTVVLRGWDRDNVKDADVREIQQRVDELILEVFDAKSVVCLANDSCSACDSDSCDSDVNDCELLSGDEEVMKRVLVASQPSEPQPQPADT